MWFFYAAENTQEDEEEENNKEEDEEDDEDDVLPPRRSYYLREHKPRTQIYEAPPIGKVLHFFISFRPMLRIPSMRCFEVCLEDCYPASNLYVSPWKLYFISTEDFIVQIQYVLFDLQ